VADQPAHRGSSTGQALTHAAQTGPAALASRPGDFRQHHRGSRMSQQPEPPAQAGNDVDPFTVFEPRVFEPDLRPNLTKTLSREFGHAASASMQSLPAWRPPACGSASTSWRQRWQGDRHRRRNRPPDDHHRDRRVRHRPVYHPGGGRHADHVSGIRPRRQRHRHQRPHQRPGPGDRRVCSVSCGDSQSLIMALPG